MAGLLNKTCTRCGEAYKVSPRGHHKARYCGDTCRKAARRKTVEKHKRQSVEVFLKTLLTGSRQRAKKKGIEHTLTYEDIEELLSTQGRRCVFTKIPFETDRRDAVGGKNPWSPSLDRVDSRKGYVKGNVQLTSLMYNMCKHTFTDDDVRTFAKSYLENKVGET